MKLKNLNFKKLQIPFKTGFKHASADRAMTESVIAIAESENVSKWGRTFLDANPDIEHKLELATQNIEIKQRFYRPVSVHVDASGMVYVADCYRHRVQIYQKL